MRSLILTVIAGWSLSPVPARAAIIVTTEAIASSSASFTFQNVNYSAGIAIAGVESASAQALAGNQNTPEGRTAARVNPSEIAVNARLDGKMFFAPTNIQDNGSVLTYTGTIEKVTGSAEHILLNFYIPPSYVETTTNAELPTQAVNPAIFAEIQAGYCTSFNSCGPQTSLFDFQAYLNSTWRSYTKLTHATGQAGLDLSPLLNPVLTDDDYGVNSFFRTVNLAFPGYAGVVDLGVLSVGQFVRFEYRMEGRALGFASANIAIASINDPFFVDSDPVSQGAPVFITTAAAANGAPEPSTCALLGSGVALFWLRARRSTDRSQR